MGEWSGLLETFGLAVVILAFIGLSTWRLAVWTGGHVVEPLVGRYLKLLDELTAAVSRQGQAVAQLCAAIDQACATMEHLQEALDRISRRAE